MFLFIFSFVYFVFHINIKIKIKIRKIRKIKKSVCYDTLVLVYLRWPLKQSFLNFVSFIA